MGLKTGLPKKRNAIVAEQQLAHIVYFTLQEKSPEQVEKLCAACRHYLTEHEGTVYFSVGTLVPDLDREVNEANLRKIHRTVRMRGVGTNISAHEHDL